MLARLQLTDQKHDAPSAEGVFPQDYYGKLVVSVFLVNGLKLQGAITEIDDFSMLIVQGPVQLLVYKHVVATILPSAPIDFRGTREAQ
jgi:RNA chaperone Hfq